ncbi:MAG: hypothetical protein LBV68_05130 [Spirochaetaceae bacterium]|jgi:hypothetical protein|nr:hypothetical protein [Spirochaetaceae bacterium]
MKTNGLESIGFNKWERFLLSTYLYVTSIGWKLLDICLEFIRRVVFSLRMKHFGTGDYTSLDLSHTGGSITIGERAVIAAGSVVVENIEPWVVCRQKK